MIASGNGPSPGGRNSRACAAVIRSGDGTSHCWLRSGEPSGACAPSRVCASARAMRLPSPITMQNSLNNCILEQCGGSEVLFILSQVLPKRISEPKPHWNQRFPVFFRIRSSLKRLPQGRANFGLGTIGAATVSEVRIPAANQIRSVFCRQKGDSLSRKLPPRVDTPAKCVAGSLPDRLLSSFGTPTRQN